MQYFTNIDELLDDQHINHHDDFIADLVVKANTAIKSHYHQFKQELRDNRQVQPIVEIEVNYDRQIIPVQIQYFNTDDLNERFNRAQIVRINHTEVECPIFVTKNMINLDRLATALSIQGFVPSHLIKKDNTLIVKIPDFHHNGINQLVVNTAGEITPNRHDAPLDDRQQATVEIIRKLISRLIIENQQERSDN